MSNKLNYDPNQLIGKVLSCAPNSIAIEIADYVFMTIDEEKRPTALEVFEVCKQDLQVGDYLRIEQGNSEWVIAQISNIKGEKNLDNNSQPIWSFLLDCLPVGKLTPSDDDENHELIFERGSSVLPVPTEPAYILDRNFLEKIFIRTEKYDFYLGKLSANSNVNVYLDGDRFFGKHIGIVGSTGSGKSSAVAKILHQAVGIQTDATNKNRSDGRKNAHIIIFDIHAEYQAAFRLEATEDFNLNSLDVDSLQLPYWLMNSEELESLFIDVNEHNAHNQVSQFKAAVIANKRFHAEDHENLDADEITYDTPCYFSLEEVLNYIRNKNFEMKDAKTGQPVILIENENEEDEGEEKRLDIDDMETLFSSVKYAAAKTSKINKGSFNGQFDRFISRLETRLRDKRLGFLLYPHKDGKELKTDDFKTVIRQYLGYGELNEANVTIVDLSGIPFEVLSITVSLISRIVFDFCFNYTKLQHEYESLNDVPVMIVCEEAHNYVPQSDSANYRASRKSIERIAKEGRKYGLSLMVVSQRPSEVSQNIFAQCNNFIALRMTNQSDQNYIQRLMPTDARSVTDILPNLSDGECIVAGDAVLIPSVVQMDKPNPAPQSQNVRFHKEWQQPWKTPSFDDVISRWRKDTPINEDPDEDE